MTKTLTQKLGRTATIASLGLTGLLGCTQVGTQLGADIARGALYSGAGAAGAQFGKDLVNPEASKPAQVNVYSGVPHKESKIPSEIQAFVKPYKIIDTNKNGRIEDNEYFPSREFVVGDEMALSWGFEFSPEEEKVNLSILDSNDAPLNHIYVRAGNSGNLFFSKRYYKLSTPGVYSYKVISDDGKVFDHGSFYVR